MKVFSSAEIMELLPYRYPMLLIDRAWDGGANKMFGLKNITVNEEFFTGHFPDHPIFPGVLQIEAAFQVASLAVTDQINGDKTKDLYIKSLKNVKFRKPLLPGDRLLVEINVISISADGDASISIINKSNSGVCSQAEMVISSRECVYDVKKPELFTKYDRTDTPAMDLATIKSFIPHRYPFLLIDYIAYAETPYITAIKNITYNECLMHSYSSRFTALSGAILCEIIAQAGCAHTLSIPENRNKLAYFMTIPNAEFYKPIHPGDQLRIELNLPPVKSKFGKGHGEIYVENELVASADLMFALVDHQ